MSGGFTPLTFQKGDVSQVRILFGLAGRIPLKMVCRLTGHFQLPDIRAGPLKNEAPPPKKKKSITSG